MASFTPEHGETWILPSAIYSTFCQKGPGCLKGPGSTIFTCNNNKKETTLSSHRPPSFLIVESIQHFSDFPQILKGFFVSKVFSFNSSPTVEVIAQADSVQGFFCYRRPWLLIRKGWKIWKRKKVGGKDPTMARPAFNFFSPTSRKNVQSEQNLDLFFKCFLASRCACYFSRILLFWPREKFSLFSSTFSGLAFSSISKVFFLRFLKCQKSGIRGRNFKQIADENVGQNSQNLLKRKVGKERSWQPIRNPRKFGKFRRIKKYRLVKKPLFTFLTRNLFARTFLKALYNFFPKLFLVKSSAKISRPEIFSPPPNWINSLKCNFQAKTKRERKHQFSVRSGKLFCIYGLLLF